MQPFSSQAFFPQIFGDCNLFDYDFFILIYFYILQDEKLQNVLGHFQKEFEAGVSAENLGRADSLQELVKHPICTGLLTPENSTNL